MAPWFCALLGVALAGCGAAPRSRFPTGDAALARMHETYACSRGVRGEANVNYLFKVRARMMYIAVLPDNLRLDIQSPFGVVLATLTTDGQRFSFFDLEQGQYVHGPARACTVERFTRVPLPPFALVQLMRGEAPVLVHTPDRISIRYKRVPFGKGYYRIKIESKHDALQEIDLEPLEEDRDLPWQEQRVRVLRVRVSQGGAPLYGAELRGHTAGRTAAPREDPVGLDAPIPPSGPPCRAELPDRLRLRVPGLGQELVLDNTEVVHNPPLVQGVFDQPIPGGVEVVYADCSN